MEFTGGESKTETPESILKDSREQGRGPQTTAPTATIACAGVIQGFRLSRGPKLPGPGFDGHCNPLSDNSFFGFRHYRNFRRWNSFSDGHRLSGASLCSFARDRCGTFYAAAEEIGIHLPPRRQAANCLNGEESGIRAVTTDVGCSGYRKPVPATGHECHVCHRALLEIAQKWKWVPGSTEVRLLE